MRYAVRWAPLLLALLSPLAGVAQTTGLAATEPELRPGDLLQIEVWGREDLSGEFRVGADGAIVHPLYQDVRVAGVPLSEAEDRILEYLAQYEAQPRLALHPQFQVTVRGEVGSPSLYTFPPEVTVTQALALAGGVTSLGAAERVRLIRDGVETLIDTTRPGLASSPVRSGDEIVVDRLPERRQIDYFGRGVSILTVLIQLVQFYVITGL